MAYIPQSNPLVVEDNTRRKEFYAVRPWVVPETELSVVEGQGHFESQLHDGTRLHLTSYQQFVGRFLNPNTPYTRCFLKWATGSGKTNAALNTALQFMHRQLRERELNFDEGGSVFVISFAERAFMNELLRNPEFGFITRDERAQLTELQQRATQGVTRAAEMVREMTIRVRKRLRDRTRGEMRFFGYKAFVNNIFQKGATTNTSSGDGNGDEDNPMNLSQMSEDDIRRALDDGRLIFNEQLMRALQNGLVICDEIHNTYNTQEKNNWGAAIQLVLDAIPTCRALFMTATPINNSPAEVVDLLNFLLPRSDAVKRSDFFTPQLKLKPGALEHIGRLSRGRVSFLRDLNPAHYPRTRMLGETIPGIPFLRFLRCPMSKFHHATYDAVYDGVLNQETQYLKDFALPNPESATLGLYRTADIKRLLRGASDAWHRKNKIRFTNGRIVGDFMKRSNIEQYSSKYARLLDELDRISRNNLGKVFVFHSIVHMSGVLFIEELLQKNGYISEFVTPGAYTKCSVCGKERRAHTKEQLQPTVGGGSGASKSAKNSDSAMDQVGAAIDPHHRYLPARFIMAHSDLDSSRMNQSIERFNNPSNARGYHFKIIVGSRVIKESYDLRAVRNVIIVGRPDNLPMMQQVQGRAVRKNSHMHLPPELRTVDI